MHEIISIDQLAERYADMNKEERREGFGATTPANHFALALLYLATDRFKLTNDHRIKIRKSSPFYRGHPPAKL